MPDMAYINGEFVPLDQAVVSINDRAFYYADAVYEVCVTIGGEIFLLDDHLDRLERSLRGIRIDYALDRKELTDLIREGVRRAGHRESLIYVQISRGAAQREKLFPAKVPPTLMMTFRKKPPPSPELFARGVEVILVPDERWAHCHYKTTMLLPNVLAHQKARDSGKHDAVFYDPDTGSVFEATSANVFIVRDQRIATPNEQPKILAGTVRRYVIDLARRQGLEVEERPVALDELLAADEVFLTGTTTVVLGVVRIDDRTIGQGVPGPMTLQLHRLFEASVGGK